MARLDRGHTSDVDPASQPFPVDGLWLDTDAMGESWVQEEVNEARQVLRSVLALIPADRAVGIYELLDSDEPQEALLSLAWILGTSQAEVPANTAARIRAKVGSLAGVHPRFSS